MALSAPNITSPSVPTADASTTAATISSSKLLIPELNLSIGLLGAITNILAFLCILSDKKFLRKSAFLTGLVVGNIFNAGYSVSNGTHRLLNALDPKRYPNYTAWDCMMAPFIPTWALIGGDAPSLIVLLFGLERLSALAAPTWHFQKWKSKWGWIAVAGVYAYVLGTVIAAWVVVGVINPSDSGKVNRDCFVHTVIGLSFSQYYYGLQIFCGITAMVATLSALGVGWCRLKRSHQDAQSQSRLEKQIKMTKHMLSLAVVDFFLVAVSNIVLYLTMLTKASGFLSGASNHGAVAYCCNATVCVLAYLGVNKHFRGLFLKFYKLDKLGCCMCRLFYKEGPSAVSPVSLFTVRPRNNVTTTM